MSDAGKNHRKGSKRKPFAHRLTRGVLWQFKDASPEAKLRWLEEANAFVNQFVSREKQERWARFVAGAGKKDPA
jgi:hypothetical protein